MAGSCSGTVFSNSCELLEQLNNFQQLKLISVPRRHSATCLVAYLVTSAKQIGLDSAIYELIEGRITSYLKQELF
jgi:hypothetical protein